MMAWQCPKCGSRPAREGTKRCEACNFIEFGQLVLTGPTGGRVVANIDTEFGRRSLAAVLGSEAQYLSPVQFRARRDTTVGAWTLDHAPEAVNQTYVNGAPLAAGPRVVVGGEALTVGADHARIIVSLA